MGIKLGSCVVAEFFDGHIQGKSLAVGSVRGHGVKCIRYGKNARFHEEFVGGDVVRIAMTVISFMMLTDAKFDVMEELDRLQYFHADDGVLLKGADIIRGKSPFLVQEA